MAKEVLKVDVNITGFEEVKGKSGEACMILFDGTAEGSGFKGVIGPSAADTQKQDYGKERFLSARYILKGKDATGKDCRIFIENNGSFEANGDITTRPLIYTDSENLAFLETSGIYGKIEGKEGGVIIHLFEE
ncbi:MAG: DUF3237 family protein [Treponema sp.]|nr:DUF3237 family protein [Treponema sp.]